MFIYQTGKLGLFIVVYTRILTLEWNEERERMLGPKLLSHVALLHSPAGSIPPITACHHIPEHSAWSRELNSMKVRIYAFNS